MAWRREVRDRTPHLPFKGEGATVRIVGVVGPAGDKDDMGVEGVHALEEEENEEEVGEVVYLEGGFIAV